MDAAVPLENVVAVYKTLARHGHQAYADSLVKRWRL